MNIKKQTGQAMTEYVVVCLILVAALFIPIGGKPLYVLVIDAIRSMHQGYMYGLSTYATPF
jgi:uncharacterized MnhB-related membrane protein